MAWLDTWGSPLLASIAGVIAAAAFTWFFSYRADRQRKQGIRALVSQELWQNEASLRTIAFMLQLVLAEDGGYARRVRNMSRTLQWQQSRWQLPDVGTAFSPEELVELSRWYFVLGGFTFLYEQDMGVIVEIARRDPGAVRDYSPVEDDVTVRGLILNLVEMAELLLKERPPLPDMRLDRDPRLRHWAEVVQAHSAAGTTPAPAESAVYNQ